MDEPACKKAKVEEFDTGEGLDGLSDLEKLDNLPGDGSTPSTSQAGMVGVSGGAPSFGQPMSSAPQASVLQELLMHQPQTNNSPRPQQFGVGPQSQGQPTFNTRSPMTNGPNQGGTMMSPPNIANSGRMSNGPPGPSPGGPTGPVPGNPANMRPMPGQQQHHAMYANDPSMGQSMPYNNMMPQQMRGFPQGFPPAGNQMQYAPGRGQQPIRQQQPMMNGQIRPGPAPNQMNRGGMMMMRGPGHPMMENNGGYGYAPQRPEYMHQYMPSGPGRGNPYLNVMHPQQPGPGSGPPMMMIDPNQPSAQMPMRPAPPVAGMPNNQSMMPNGNLPGQGANPAPMNLGSGNRTPGLPATPGSQDPEKRKLIQQQLVLLLHAHKCQQRESRDPTVAVENGRNANCCTLPHCSTMKEVLHHMTTCNNGRTCIYPHCASSRQIIAHWKNCQREDCPVCKPLKSIQNNPNGGTNNASQFSNIDNLLGPSSHGPASIGNPSSVSAGLGGPQSVDPSMAFGSPGPSSMPSGPMNPTQLLNDYTPQQSDNFRSPNLPNRTGGPGFHFTKLSDIQACNFPPPEVPSTVRDWHVHVTKDLRNHLVGKLVKAIFPSPDPNALLDQRIRDLINYARKVEKEMFETANDREEYYHLLAEKIYKIQKELQEKKQSRLKPDGVANTTTNAGVMNVTDIVNEIDMPGAPNKTIEPSVANSHNNWTNDTSENQPPNYSQNSSQGSAAGTPIVKSEPLDDIKSSHSSYPNSIATSSSTPGLNGLSTVKKEEPSTPNSSVLPAAEQITPKKEIIKREDTPPPGEDRNFEADTLRMHLLPVWERLHNCEDAMPFRAPVDPVLLNIPDYYDIVKKPMDLMTISRNLDNGNYLNASEFCDDVWLMLENAWLYNRKNSKVYKFSTKLSELFMAEMDPVMKNMGYCCSKKLSYTPLPLFCYGAAMCTIARDQPYMVFEVNNSQFGVTVSDRFTYCMKCFEALPPEGISLSDNPTDTSNMAAKDSFIQLKNNVIEYEPFEKCKYCHRKWHRICALFDKKVFPDGFICDTCRTQKTYPKPENRFTAKKLPHNKLSSFLEDRVNTYIKKNSAGKSEQCEVIIRTLCVQDKEVEVKAQMKAKYASQGFPDRFPYRTKAVFAFEVIDGVEVCFFGLHVQEYGSNVPSPNQRRVYIAYLDSVHFFQPRELRTDVYHEILLGYLDYAKQLGYTMAHIWACPPSEGDDYIFHCHPPEQKIPKAKRLQDWYKKMLDKGVQEQTVMEYKDIYKQARDDNLITPMTLPYFEGDFWPNVIEDCIRDANNGEAQRKKQEAAEVDEDDEDIFTTGENGKKKSSKNKKNNLKKNSKMNKKKQGSGTGNEVADRLYNQLEKHKDVFFTIRLVSQQSEQSLGNQEIVDPDPLMSSEMMDGRDTFLNKAREEHWEFSSLRRAKYSTLALCHALHEMDNKETYTCNKCSQNAAKYHCTVCEDYDLCDSCFKEHPHPHQMEPIKSLISTTEGDSSSSSRHESIQRCIASLVHACQCRDANCRRMSCHKMKKVVQHTKMCKKRVNSNCPVCKQLIALCCYHAKHCTRDPCSVPFCMNIRQKLAEQKRSLARRSDMMMRRRMEVLQQGAGSSSGSQSVSQSQNVPNASTPPLSKPASVTATSAGTSMQSLNSSASASLGQMNRSGYPGGPMHNQVPPQTGGMQAMPSGVQNRFPNTMQQPGMNHMNTGGQQVVPNIRQGAQPNNVGAMVPARAGPPSMQPPPYRAPNTAIMNQSQQPGVGGAPVSGMNNNQMGIPGQPVMSGVSGQMTGDGGMSDDRMRHQHQLNMVEQRLRSSKSQAERYPMNGIPNPGMQNQFMNAAPGQQQFFAQGRPGYNMGGPPMGQPGWPQQQQNFAQRPNQGPAVMNQQFGQMQGRSAQVGLSPMTGGDYRGGIPGQPGQPPMMVQQQGVPPHSDGSGGQFR